MALAFFFGMGLSAHAQHFSVGGALIYGDEIHEPGINLRLAYHVNHPLAVVGEYTYFQSHYARHEKKKLWEANLNLEYSFPIVHHLYVYPVVGLNYSQEAEYEALPEGGDHGEHYEPEPEHIVGKFGLNMGVGMHYHIGDFEPFVEYDHLFSELHQNNFAVGVMYHLPFGKKHNSHPLHKDKHHKG